MKDLRADLHTHTKYSIEPLFLRRLQLRALYSPERLVKTAIQNRINVLAITDHDTMEGARVAKKYIKKKRIDDFTLIKGEEVSTSKGHIIGLGLEENIKPRLSPEETIDKIKQQGGLVMIPHAYCHLGIKDLVKKIRGVDAIEIYNPYNRLNNGPMRNPPRLYKKIANQRGCTKVIGTDAHTLENIGKIYTKIHTEYGVDNVLKAIKKQKTKCVDKTTPLHAIGTLIKTLALTTQSFRDHPLRTN